MKKVFASLALISFALTVGACAGTSSPVSIESSEPEVSSSEPISSSSQEASSSSKAVVNNQLSTESGLKVTFNEKGARISKIEFEGKQIAKDGFTVGRVAGRIANGQFVLNGTTYNVHKNVGNHSLHGGDSKDRQWQGTIANANWTKVGQTENSIEFSYASPNGENGYPGNMNLTVKYTLSEQGELSIEYGATTDADTLYNPTNHLYMALNGNTSYNNIKLWIDGDNYTPLANDIPTGDITPVAGTQFDYREEKVFDSSKSYDHNYVLNGTLGQYRKVATMTGTSLGVKVDVYTDRPGLQLYKESNGNICLETQQLPNSINTPSFAAYGTTILRANETFSSKTTYYFSKVSA